MAQTDCSARKGNQPYYSGVPGQARPHPRFAHARAQGFSGARDSLQFTSSVIPIPFIIVILAERKHAVSVSWLTLLNTIMYRRARQCKDCESFLSRWCILWSSRSLFSASSSIFCSVPQDVCFDDRLSVTPSSWLWLIQPYTCARRRQIWSRETVRVGLGNFLGHFHRLARLFARPNRAWG